MTSDPPISYKCRQSAWIDNSEKFSRFSLTEVHACSILQVDREKFSLLQEDE